MLILIGDNGKLGAFICCCHKVFYLVLCRFLSSSPSLSSPSVLFVFCRVEFPWLFHLFHSYLGKAICMEQCHFLFWFLNGCDVSWRQHGQQWSWGPKRTFLNIDRVIFLSPLHIEIYTDFVIKPKGHLLAVNKGKPAQNSLDIRHEVQYYHLLFELTLTDLPVEQWPTYPLLTRCKAFCAKSMRSTQGEFAELSSICHHFIMPGWTCS